MSDRWHEEIITGRGAVEGIRTDMDASLAAIAARAGRLQAHVTRLDALAERVVTLAGLAEDEFNLTAPPALGGPQSFRQSKLGTCPRGPAIALDRSCAARGSASRLWKLCC